MSSTPADSADSQPRLSVRLLSPAPDLADLPAISGLLPSASVGQLKSRVRQLLSDHGHSTIGLRLIYLGRVLDTDTRTLLEVFSEASIQENAVFILHLVLRDYNRAPTAPAIAPAPAAPATPAAAQAFAPAPQVLRVTHQVTWTNTAAAGRPNTGSGTADQGGSSLNSATVVPEYRLAGRLQERHSDVHTTYNSRAADSLAPQRALTPAEVERIIAVADATRNLQSPADWARQRLNARDFAGRLAHQAAAGASTHPSGSNNTTHTAESGADSGTSPGVSSATAGGTITPTVSWEPRPSQPADVYILASPTGPRGLLINGGVEAYYTPPVAFVDPARTTRSEAFSTGVDSAPGATTAGAAVAARPPMTPASIEQQRILLLQRAHMLAQRRLQHQLHQHYLQQLQQQQQSRLQQLNVQQQILQQHQQSSQHQRTIDEHLAIHNRLHQEFQQRNLQNPELVRHFQQLHQQAALSGQQQQRQHEQQQQQQQSGLVPHGPPMAPQMPPAEPAVAGAGVAVQQERQPHQRQGQHHHLQQPPQVRIHIRANNPGVGLLAAMWPHIWLMARLMLFVWWFTTPTASWSRWVLVLLLATGVFVMNTGLLDGIANEAWTPVREHLDRILHFEDPALVAARRGETAAVANMDGSTEVAARPGAGRVGGGQQREPDPAEVAARLMAQRRNANTERLVDFARYLERLGIMFLASIAPGIAERHVAQVEAAERAAREERVRQRQRQEEEAAAAAATAAAEAEAAAAAAESAAVATVTPEVNVDDKSVGADTAGEKQLAEENNEVENTEASDTEKAAMAAALGGDGQGRHGAMEGQLGPAPVAM